MLLLGFYANPGIATSLFGLSLNVLLIIILLLSSTIDKLVKQVLVSKKVVQ